MEMEHHYLLKFNISIFSFTIFDDRRKMTLNRKMVVGTVLAVVNESALIKMSSQEELVGAALGDTWLFMCTRIT